MLLIHPNRSSQRILLIPLPRPHRKNNPHNPQSHPLPPPPTPPPHPPPILLPLLPHPRRRRSLPLRRYPSCIVSPSCLLLHTSLCRSGLGLSNPVEIGGVFSREFSEKFLTL